ncbi:PAS domain S-box protein [Algoriphagus halophytocola]|uniref:histidine kinase n=1 Tax=Algoriphagus halophytocola TaxID=2991499 RepID=A0ABY6ME30_9BACT|nr:PAS domain S-box protein [Algoriphagus sp. TR-M5]UZD21828.1 PAS domain S-box protein [Algoriphagus sp. TR-M5]
MAASKSSFSNSKSKNLIFDLAPFPMWIYDMETYAFLEVNREAMRQYGYTEEEFLKMNLRDIRPAEDIPILEKAIADSRHRKEIYKDSGLFRHQRKDGSILYVHIKRNLIKYQDKEAEIVTAIDLTERYEREKEIEKKKALLATVGKINEIFLKSESWTEALRHSFQIVGNYLKVSRICFSMVAQGNSDGQYTTLNWEAKGELGSNPLFREFRKVLFEEFPHYQQSILAGEPVPIKAAELPDSRSKYFLEQHAIKSLMQIPLMIKGKMKGVFTIDDSEVDGEFFETNTQIVNTLISNLSHVISQDQVQQQLADSEARFRALVQKGTDLIAIIDAEGNYKYVAPTSLNVLGIPADEFMGRNAFEFIHQEDAPRLMKDLEQLETKNTISIEPYRFQDAHGDWRWIQTDLTNHIQDPVLAGIVANTREVTHEVEKRISAQLLASLTKAISQPGTLSTCLTDALEEICNLCDFDIAEMWMIAEDRSRLDLMSKAGKKAVAKEFYSSTSHIHTFEIGDGLPGMVWQKKQTQILEHIEENELFLRANAADGSGLQTALGIPLLYNKEFLGCLICLSPLSKKEIGPHAKILNELGVQLAAVIKQKMTEEQFRSFFNISPDPHGLLGFDGYLKKVNHAFAKVLGYDKSELFSKPVFAFLLEEDRPKAQKRLNELMNGADTDSFEARFLTKEGDIKWLVWKGTVIMESKIIVAAAKDITVQKEAEIKLSNTNERLKRAQKIAKLGYWSRNLDSDLTEWSEETYRIHGFTPGSFIPTLEDLKNTFHPDDRYLLESEPIKFLEPGRINSFEHRIVTATNEIKWVQQEIRLLLDDHQVPYRIEGTIQDITERKENELQLALSNERFQLAIKASNEMIWEVDHQKETIYRGAGYTKFVNYKSNEPFNKENSWCVKLSTAEMDEVWASLQKALADKTQNFWSAEYRINTEDGSIAYFVDRCFILRDKNGTPIRSVGSALDVTESKKQLMRIKKQNEKLREIAWLQSHVIRAPLSRIMSLIYLIKDLDGGGMALDEILELISASADELDQVIHDIINKTEAVKEDENTNPID